MSSYLAKPFAEERFAFHEKIVKGVPVMLERWKQVDMPESAQTFACGRGDAMRCIARRRIASASGGAWRAPV